MALATKCPRCGALFRVVADQLKLRGGLVRCGQCRTVFDAIGSLAYVDDATLAATLPEGGATTKEASVAPKRDEPADPSIVRAGRSAAVRAQGKADRKLEHAERKRRALGPATTLRIAPGAAPVATVSQELPATEPAVERLSRKTGPSPSAAESGVPTLIALGLGASDGEAARASLEGIEVIEVAAPPPDVPDAGSAPADEPEFIRTARRTPARGFSVFFSGGSMLLLLLALAQIAVVFRADVLTRWPAVRPALLQICQAFGCRVEWPTQPDQLAVIGSELQSIAGTDVLELSAVIRNRAAFTQSLPALEVTLSDTQNRPVARKVFSPADYLAAAGEPSTRIDEGLAAGADMTIRLFFEARGLQAAGFLVYPFFR
jgi:predicted Zn finger-like uncharacterized protein